MSTNNESTCPVPVLMLPKRSKDIITFARSVHDGLRDNPAFPNPNPTLVMFAADIAASEDAETKAASRAKGAAAFRDAKLQILKGGLSHLRDYVHSVVEKNTSPAEATAMIQSVFMSVRKTPKRSFPELSAKNGDASGQVRLAAKAVAPTAVYYWEYSDDQETWTALPQSMLTRAEVSGLKPVSTYYFRFRTFTRAGWQPYSQVVSLLVL